MPTCNMLSALTAAACCGGGQRPSSVPCAPGQRHCSTEVSDVWKTLPEAQRKPWEHGESVHLRRASVPLPPESGQRGKVLRAVESPRQGSAAGGNKPGGWVCMQAGSLPKQARSVAQHAARAPPHLPCYGNSRRSEPAGRASSWLGQGLHEARSGAPAAARLFEGFPSGGQCCRGKVHPSDATKKPWGKGRPGAGGKGPRALPRGDREGREGAPVPCPSLPSCLAPGSRPLCIHAISSPCSHLPGHMAWMSSADKASY